MIFISKADLNILFSIYSININSVNSEKEFKSLLDDLLKIFTNIENLQKSDISQFEIFQFPLIFQINSFLNLNTAFVDLKNLIEKFSLKSYTDYLEPFNRPLIIEKNSSIQLKDILGSYNKKLDDLNLKVLLNKDKSTEKIEFIELSNRNFKSIEYSKSEHLGLKQIIKASYEKTTYEFTSTEKETTLDFMNEYLVTPTTIKGNQVQKSDIKPDTVAHKINEISDIIAKAVFNSKNTVTLQLQPPELGRILIKLTLNNSGIKADVKVENPQIREVLAGLIPEIRNNLQSSGIKVSDFLLEIMKDHTEYPESYSNQGQKRYKNQKFFEYVA
ncbi:MAG: flagellar hook-length control protein FliK [Thermodesulfovibrionaceae bacterium]